MPSTPSTAMIGRIMGHLDTLTPADVKPVWRLYLAAAQKRVTPKIVENTPDPATYDHAANVIMARPPRERSMIVAALMRHQPGNAYRLKAST